MTCQKVVSESLVLNPSKLCSLDYQEGNKNQVETLGSVRL